MSGFLGIGDGDGFWVGSIMRKTRFDDGLESSLQLMDSGLIE